MAARPLGNKLGSETFGSSQRGQHLGSNFRSASRAHLETAARVITWVTGYSQEPGPKGIPRGAPAMLRSAHADVLETHPSALAGASPGAIPGKVFGGDPRPAQVGSIPGKVSRTPRRSFRRHSWISYGAFSCHHCFLDKPAESLQHNLGTCRRGCAASPGENFAGSRRLAATLMHKRQGNESGV